MARGNTQQLAAIESNANKILCLAGAGTGKTFTMIERIVRLVNDGVNPSSILALTFTNAAAFEMKERYKKLGVSIQIPEFRTFHSFCYSILSSDPLIRNHLGYSKTPSIADEGMTKRYLARAQVMCGTNFSDKELNDANITDPQKKYKVDLVKKAMNKFMQQDGYITFDALCYRICEMFETDHRFIQRYKQQYTYIFVDEFQDTDPRQWRFVQSFENANLFVVGDALQAIYAFRGADSSIIKSLSTDPEWEVHKLYENYRSTESICNYANDFSVYADPNYRIAISSARKGDPVIDLSRENFNRVEWSDNPCNTYRLHECIQHFIDHSGDGAILVKTNKEVAAICRELDDLEIPYVTSRPNVDAMHILKSVLDGQYMLDWLSTFLNADRYAEYLKSESLIEDESESNMTKVKRFLQDYGRGKITKYADTIFSIRSILKDVIDPLNRCNSILEALDIDNIAVDGDAVRNAEYDNMLLIEYLISELEKQQECDLYVGTIHSSKGLEYANVYVMNVNYRTFQLKNEESKNLFYVAVTRAKNQLIVC